MRKLLRGRYARRIRGGRARCLHRCKQGRFRACVHTRERQLWVKIRRCSVSPACPCVGTR